MKLTLCRSSLVILFLAAGRSSEAAPQYYNVDSVTLPGGPIELQMGTITPLGGGSYELTGNVVNTSLATTYDNVAFLNEWLFDATTPMAYGGANNWSSGDGNSISVPAQVNLASLFAGDVLPVPTTSGSPKFPSDADASVAPTDLLPDITIGTLAPGASVPFTEYVNSSTGAFDVIGSFVSTAPVPEPSTVVLFGLGALGAVCFAKRRKRITDVR